jgi:hypothetical protein
VAPTDTVTAVTALGHLNSRTPRTAGRAWLE